MDFILFGASGMSLLYYISLVLLTDASWLTQIYWPVSTVVFLLAAIILRIDRKRRQQDLLCMPLELRVAISTSFLLYMILIFCFSMAILLFSHPECVETADYLLMIENNDVETSLTEIDYDMLDRGIQYMNDHPETKIVLSGSSRFSEWDVDDEKVQDMMKKYLMEAGIGSSRIITEEISSSIRQNIVYGYAYILVDWYREQDTYEEDRNPVVAVITEPAAALRYSIMLKDMRRDMKILTGRENLLAWPARIMEEIELIIRYHLDEQLV